LRTGSNRLNADLQLLEGNLSEVRDSVSPRHPFEPETAPAETYDKAAALPDVEEQPSGDYSAAAELASEEETGFDAAVAEPGPSPAGGGDESEGARLIALNMALNGSPREETDRYLAENFSLSDRAGLLDEVYASVEG